ncbi:acetyl-coenzyme A transporter 1-domain-containing protein [Thamnocephalis sphaerospora]|uniref:Acetyl-coenzyme A transporter 1-domain-containing protein n=1 Tax=Thamnocephalis sphaerospora TaxID=78915 RepID=A0A4P9XV18_9FUNG|nr:acetyl-coenzyme A transporter 1-domain-containing protein [Thamnocephalis sphaerospora]|eukprot:RKP10093.1 acetyl-coenzyme A transporter 1-domain-containing protein [Thamnocephalis sphaerospora]
MDRKEKINVALLVVLYLLQGIPTGLAFGSIPFLMKEHMSYSQIGVFTLSTYPYSLKLFWSPIVDSVFSSAVGRRKTWIVPIQLILGAIFFWLAGNIDVYMAPKGDGWENTYALTFIFLVVVFLSATQDIAVDGWALNLLSEENLSYASTAQTVGLNTGYFVSFTVFLAFNSAEFSNKYFRSVPSDIGMLPLGTYLYFWGCMYFLVTTLLIFFKREEPPPASEKMNIGESYETLWKMCKLPQMRHYIALLLLAKVGFVAGDAVTGLKLLEKGFQKEDLALAVLLDFPCQILFGYLAARWSTGKRPLRPWLLAFYGRLLTALMSMLVVPMFPEGGVTTSYFVLVIFVTILGSFMSTVQFVGMGVFMTGIADATVGGTYMTFLNTLSNLGGTWPRYFVLEAVDWFSNAQCNVPTVEGVVAPEAFQCVSEAGKNQCKEVGGQCEMIQDGFYTVCIASVVLGTALLFLFIQKTARRLEVIPASAWRITKIAKD